MASDFLLGLLTSILNNPTFYESAADGDLFGQDSFSRTSESYTELQRALGYVTPGRSIATTTFVQGHVHDLPGAPLGYLVPGIHSPVADIFRGCARASTSLRALV